MKMTEEQQKAIRLMGEGYGILSSNWSDELGEALNDMGLLPMRSLDEAESECFHIVESAEISNSK